MKLSRLSVSEGIGVLGSLMLVGFLFAPWYRLGPRDTLRGHGPGSTLSGWEAEPVIRWFLLVAALAPLILAYIILRNRELSWPRGEMTAVVGMVAVVLIAFVAIISVPGRVPGLTSVQFGAYLCLLGAVLETGSAAYRASSAERPRKPPGVL